MKKILLAMLAGLAALLGLIALRTVALGAERANLSIAPVGYNVYDGEAIAMRLGRAIRLKTISHGLERQPDAAAFEGFAAFLEETYPAAHAAMTRETVGDHSLLYRWPGGDNAQKPVGLIAHIDVVPVEQGTEDQWTRPPFSGAVHEAAVWGRGSLDNKGQLIAIMEAAERLAGEGFAPSRDIYLMFGDDEELGGEAGAGAIAATLKERGVHFAWTLDEGSGLVSGVVPGVARPVALISTAEKGSTTLRLTATAPGGHSSAPGKDTAVSLAARAVVAVTDGPYPLKIDGNVVSFLHAVAPELPFVQRAVLANLWLTGPLVAAQLGRDPTTAAALHTTTAATIIDGGTKVNVLPQQASALVNYRIHPRDTVDGVRERAIRLIDDDRVAVEVVGGRAPSPQASAGAEGYRAIEESIAIIFRDPPTAPFLTLQGTDTRHYVGLADDNYRFAPFIFESGDLRRIHGTNERARIDDLARAAAWYEVLLRKAAG